MGATKQISLFVMRTCSVVHGGAMSCDGSMKNSSVGTMLMEIFRVVGRAITIVPSSIKSRILDLSPFIAIVPWGMERSDHNP